MKAVLCLLRENSLARRTASLCSGLPRRSPRASCLQGAVLFLVLLVSSGCSTRYIRGRFEKRIAARLRTLIGPADDYRVRIFDTKDPELVVGSIRRLEVDGTNVLAGGLIRLDALRVRARGIRFSGGRGDLARVQESHVEVEISEDALNTYLQHAHRREQARARLNDGTVTLFGTVSLLGVRAPIETTGRLAIAEGRQIVYRAEQVFAPTLRLPGTGAEFVERQVNPLVDMARLDWPVRLETIRVSGGKVILEGTLELPPQDQ
jgi:LmeA-like phospholipid-binding